MAAFKKALLAFFEEIPQMILTSSEKQLGKEDVLNFIQEVNQNFIVPQFDFEEEEEEEEEEQE
jgi:GTP-binding protein